MVYTIYYYCYYNLSEGNRSVGRESPHPQPSQLLKTNKTGWNGAVTTTSHLLPADNLSFLTFPFNLSLSLSLPAPEAEVELGTASTLSPSLSLSLTVLVKSSCRNRRYHEFYFPKLSGQASPSTVTTFRFIS